MHRTISLWLAIVNPIKIWYKYIVYQTNLCEKGEFDVILQSIYITCDCVILKLEARVQIYMAVSNIGCKIQNSGGNVISFSKVNSCEISF